MSNTVQIVITNDVHKRLEEKASQEGLSLSQYLLKELTALARSLTLAEAYERAKLRGPVKPGLSAEEIIRDIRDSR